MSRVRAPIAVGLMVVLGVSISLVVSSGAARTTEIESLQDDVLVEEPETQEVQKVSRAPGSNNSSESNVSQLSESEYLVFSKGYEEGFQKGNKSGYSAGFIKGYKKNPDTPEYFPHAKLSYREQTIDRDGFTFTFGKVRSDYVGMSWPENDTVRIEISSIGAAGELESLCDHEMAHQFFPGFEHSTFDTRDDPIYRYSDDMDIKICDWLTKELSENGMNR